ncbi:MAG: HNH endonuclease [Rickettsiales bacterium]|nr:HNH endonuclease [Rickettsiales bacterium]
MGREMKTAEIKELLQRMPVDKFVSSAHTSQHRIFGFITTNIRSINTIGGYIEELLPEYINRKKNYASWERWFSSAEVLKKHKQKFRRLELAKILFRKVDGTPHINKIGEKLYRISQTSGRQYLDFILHLYLLTARYFDVDNQPLVEIEKILFSYKGDFLADSRQVLEKNTLNRLMLAAMFYNPSVPEALDISYDLLEDTISADAEKLLSERITDRANKLYKRVSGAGSVGNFRGDIEVILNYFLFKQSCEKYAESAKYEDIMRGYVDSIFNNKLDKYFKIDNKDKLLDILLDAANRIMFKDIFEFALKIEFNNQFVKTSDRKNIKQQAFNKYGYKCFFDHVSKTDEERRAHSLNYFNTRKAERYLEGHHMVQKENAKFFEKSVDVVENIIPVCPNCHRKLHNADAKVVLDMLRVYYANTEKQERQRKGIFVDIDTLASFYGIEGD